MRKKKLGWGTTTCDVPSPTWGGMLHSRVQHGGVMHLMIFPAYFTRGLIDKSDHEAVLL